MKTYYVIKQFATEVYFSVNNIWDGWNMCKEFATKEEALQTIVSNSLGMCVIEEVFDSNL
jgi:hypothetical protein